MQVLELLNKSTEYLEKKGIESSRTEAEILVCEVLDCKRVDIYADFEKQVNETEKEKLRSFLRRRVNGEPLQYITGKTQFRFIDLFVEEGVFIPRPETEILVQIALKEITGKQSLKILEIGTGTGAIALSLAKEAGMEVTAVDIDPKAVKLTEKNARTLGLENKVKVLKSDLFENINDRKYDLILSNPPYIADGLKESLPKDVQKEPDSALYGGAEGLDKVKKILKQAIGYLENKGSVILEISPEQVEKIKKYCKDAGYSEVLFDNDLAGKVRFVKAKWKS